MQLPTVKIKASNKSGYIVINEDDFDQKIHNLYAEFDEAVTKEDVVVTKFKPEPKKKRGRPSLEKKEEIKPSKEEHPFD